ncbi:YibE/F family protein [Patescibacteria group bacterium]|nr:YibE/F family protein [Patescibacteria group bacterium]MBU1889930.1 YibE/F family protein [Patescibacteria group bacterium]
MINNRIIKVLLFITVPIISVFLLLPLYGHAQTENTDDIFEAKVVGIIEEKVLVREDGSENIQQNLKLLGLTERWQGKEFNFNGIGELDVINSNVYKVGDHVLVNHLENSDGQSVYYIVDYIRRSNLYLLALVFAIIVIAIGKWKGLKALISLIGSFTIIMGFIIPNILNGHSPLIIGLIGTLAILVFVIYITEGFNLKSHISVLSIFICLFFTYILSIIFTSVTHLTGMAQEEIMYLVGIGHGTINFKGLLLTAIIIGTLGVLDDVVISQVTSARQIIKANPSLSRGKVFSMTFEVGKSHLASMVNTLFLAYAGASLPLLILFSLNQPPFLSFSQVINNELIATEIVRTMVGSIGIALAVPISTFLAAYFYSKKHATESVRINN